MIYSEDIKYFQSTLDQTQHLIFKPRQNSNFPFLLQ